MSHSGLEKYSFLLIQAELISSKMFQKRPMMLVIGLKVTCSSCFGEAVEDDQNPIGLGFRNVMLISLPIRKKN